MTTEAQIINLRNSVHAAMQTFAAEVVSVEKIPEIFYTSVHEELADLAIKIHNGLEAIKMLSGEPAAEDTALTSVATNIQTGYVAANTTEYAAFQQRLIKIFDTVKLDGAGIFHFLTREAKEVGNAVAGTFHVASGTETNSDAKSRSSNVSPVGSEPSSPVDNLPSDNPNGDTRPIIVANGESAGYIPAAIRSE